MTNEERKLAVIFGVEGALGKAVCSTLLLSGWDAILVGPDPAFLDELALFGPLNGRNARTLTGRLHDREAMDVALEQLGRMAPRLDAAIFLATPARPTPLDEAGTAAFDAQLEENLCAPLRLIRGVLPMMGEGARLVAVESLLARQGVPDMHGAAASHSGAVGVMRALGLELARKGITANAVLPAIGDTPMGRPVGGAEVAAAVMFFLALEAGAITGQAINVCGGATI